MTALLIIIAAVALLIAGYIFYGSWLAKQWGIDPARKTPAHEKGDGITSHQLPVLALSTALFRLPYSDGFLFSCGV